MRRHSLRVLGRTGAHGPLPLSRLPKGERQRLFGDIDHAGGAVRVLKGRCAEYRTVAESGSIARREFCGVCGTPLFASSLAKPDLVGVKASSLDDPSWFAPEADVWMASAQPWDPIEPGVPQFDKNRPSPGAR
jgi:hypothetical protein